MNYRMWHEREEAARNKHTHATKVKHDNIEPDTIQTLDHWSSMAFGAGALLFMSFLCITAKSGNVGQPWMWWIATIIWILWYVVGWFDAKNVRAKNIKNAQLSK